MTFTLCFSINNAVRSINIDYLIYAIKYSTNNEHIFTQINKEKQKYHRIPTYRSHLLEYLSLSTFLN